VPPPAAVPKSGALVEAREEELREDEDDTPLKLPMSLLHWHWANLEYANGTQLWSLSNRWWDADDEFDFDGGHYLLPDGYVGEVSAKCTSRFGEVYL
jgi:ABC-type glycerol-3-phosphate transport system substrate-binding protein